MAAEIREISWNIYLLMSLTHISNFFRGEFPEANDIWVWWATRATRVAMSTYHLESSPIQMLSDPHWQNHMLFVSFSRVLSPCLEPVSCCVDWTKSRQSAGCLLHLAMISIVFASCPPYKFPFPIFWRQSVHIFPPNTNPTAKNSTAWQQFQGALQQLLRLAVEGRGLANSGGFRSPDVATVPSINLNSPVCVQGDLSNHT